MTMFNKQPTLCQRFMRFLRVMLTGNEGPRI